MTDLRDILLKLIEIETHIIKGFDIVIGLIEEMKETNNEEKIPKMAKVHTKESSSIQGIQRPN